MAFTLSGHLDALAAMDDDELRAVVRTAYLPALLAALAHVTGDLSLVADDLRPDPARYREPQGGMTGAQRADGRQRAVAAIRRLGALVADAAAEPPALPDDDTLRRLISFAAGEPVPDDYLPLLLEELAAGGTDPRAPSWTKAGIDADRDFRVAVVGAGMSGLIAGHRLGQAGITYVVFEKNDDVGGTWYENRYPGCRVDVPNHLYSYSFAQRLDWPHRFSPRDVLLDYFRSATDDFGVRPNLRLGTEVTSAVFSEETGLWTLTVRGRDGATEQVEVNAVVSAVGQLNRPRLPEIEGRDSFAGPSFHSARWDPSVDLTAKRVAVIGTGASGIQIIPTIAGDVAELLVFQRTPSWFMPTPEYHAPMPEGMQRLLSGVPFYAEWYRFALFWRLAEGAVAAARVDPEWDEGGRSVSRLNHDLRTILAGYLEAQFADRPDLVEQVVPRYPPLAKRILLDDGAWATTLKLPHVRLIADRIAGITPDGVVTGDGDLHPVDVIVYATGFRASEFLMPMQVTGRDGADLHAVWADNAHAHVGITVPRFPNLFCLYGPNTNLVANGSIIFFSECEVRYVLGCVRLLLEERMRFLDCRQEACDAYNLRIDEGNAAMAWGASSVNSWYKNAAGRVTQNWPFSLLEFWAQTQDPDPDDYELG
jgi:4-hydroxyacetophenone monooxygenase